jgi:ribonuclease J
VLDIGQPLDCQDADDAEMPAVPGLEVSDPALLGIVLSHPHLDHYGLAFRTTPGIPFIMGAATERILAAAAVFTPSGGTFQNVRHLENGKPLELGPFRITPFLADHSAYDAYSLLVEADGRRLFYTGDLRGHGRKAALFERLLAHPPEGVDVLLMEGTTVSRTGTGEGFPTETDLEHQLVGLFKETKGLPLVWCSGQNIDRLVTVFRAVKRSNRQFIIDMYTAHILRATENPRLPQADWAQIRVFLPHFQKLRIVRDQAFDVSNLYSNYRIYPEELVSAASHSVMLFRPSMQIDVEKAGCLDGACLIYSMWDGYLKDEKQKPFLAWLESCGIPLHKCHTSGHASLRDLKRLRTAFESAKVVPIHCAEPELFEKDFERVERHLDNEWWEVN